MNKRAIKKALQDFKNDLSINIRYRQEKRREILGEIVMLTKKLDKTLAALEELDRDETA